VYAVENGRSAEESFGIISLYRDMNTDEGVVVIEPDTRPCSIVAVEL
jgi:hypothetical protein